MKKLIKKILQEQEEETPPKGTYHREGDVEEWRINPYEFNTTNYKEMLAISYSVHSYYGTGNKDYDKHPYYISFELAGSKEFGDAMRSMVS